MRRTAAVLAILTCAIALLSGCGDDEQADDPGGTTTTETKTIQITFSGDTVEPNGERVEVKAGQEIELVVKADKPGELHVHSNPEQEFEYGAGTTTLTMDPIEEPGVVDVESHHLEVVIVQLEVS